MAAAEYRVGIDWDGDGDTTGVGEDVTGRALSAGGVSISYGRDQARMLAPMSPGEAAMLLDNSSGDYLPENVSSPLAGQLLPGRQVEITADHDGTTYSLYRGHLDDYEVLPDLAEQRLRVSCLDPVGRLRGQRATTGLYQGIQTGTAVSLLLDAVGWPADARDLDQGATTIPWWWCQDVDAYDMLGQLLDSEGPGAMATVDGDGQFVFRGRHHRLRDARSTQVQATWRGAGAEPLLSPPITYDHGLRDIVNTMSVSVPVRAPVPTLAVVWRADAPVTVADGQTIQISAVASSPVLGARAIAGTDWTAVGAATVTLDRTSGQTITVAVSATGGPAVISGLQIRAYPLDTVTTVQVGAEDTVSIGRYGRRSPPAGRDPVWAGVHDAHAICALTLAARAERLPVVTATMVGATDQRLTEMLGRDLADRVHITDSVSGTDADYYVERIAHTITGVGAQHVTKFGCEKVPVPVPDVLILNDATLGRLDVGRLGGIAQTEPDRVYVLDDATQGRLGVGMLGY